MASPAVVNSAESVQVSVTTSHVITLPSSRVVGNLLVVILGKGSTAATINALAGWTEVVDENLARGLYMAVRVIDGTESATITLTSSASTKSATIAYQISGAADPGTQLPQLSTVATGTSPTNPNATTVTPTGGSKDYLWIAIAIMGGELADSDTWATAPSGYSGVLMKTADVAGTNIGVEVSTAHKQSTAASEDSGAWTMTTILAWRAWTLAIHPGAPPTATTVARISLESKPTPDTRTFHTIKARVRKASGTSTVLFKAALYEGGTNRSGDLATAGITTSFADYTLTIADASAANITDYSNLEIRFWATCVAGDTINVDVANIYLETPQGTVAAPGRAYPLRHTSMRALQRR